MRLVKPEATHYAGKVVATGDLRPEQAAQLGFSVPGTLQQVYVKRGQSVKAGEILGQLDTSLAHASLAQADAGLLAAQAHARMAADAVARLQPVREIEGVSAAQVVQAESQRDLTAAQVEQAKAQKEQAEVNLRFHSLRAPFAGIVTRVPDGVGIIVSGGTALFGLEATGTLVLATSLTLEEARSIVIGSKARVSTPADGAVSDQATVRAVVKSADPTNHRIPVEIAVPNADGHFLAHAFARVELGEGVTRNALKVPSGALVQRQGAFSVWVAGSDGVARSARVELLNSENEFAIVAAVDALTDADRVVDLPPLDIAEGQPLTVVSR